MKTSKKIASFLLAVTIVTPASALLACSEKPTQNGMFPILPPLTSETPILPEEPIIPETPSAPSIPEVSPDTSPDLPETPSEPESPPAVQAAQYLRCTADSVNFRTGAGTEYAVLGQAHKDEAYAVLEKKGNWYKTYYRGSVAYIYASYATVFTIEKSKNEKAEQSIEEGYKLLGVPYVYGAVRLHDGKGNFLKGFTAQKFDCSSLVQYMFYHGANTLLDVTTRTQVVQGEWVARANLQRGDCIYFTNESRNHLSGVNRVGHVAVYLGDNYILHTASDYARIEKISATRWSYYIETRRFV